jgi:hypothetical protein
MLLQTELVEALDRHIATHPITATAFGRQVARDPALVFDIRRGRSPSLNLAEKIMAAIKAQQAENQSAPE